MKRFLTFMTVLALLFASLASAQATMLDTAVKLAEFHLPTYGGGTAENTSYTGRGFMMVYGTPDQLPSLMTGLISQKPNFDAAGVPILICVNMSGRDVSSFDSYYQRTGWKNFTYAMDADGLSGKLSENLRAVGYFGTIPAQPCAFMVDPTGHIRSHFVGCPKLTSAIMRAILGVSTKFKVSLSFTNKYLAKGKSYTLKPAVTPAFAKKYIQYTSNNPDKVKVSSAGVLTSRVKGSTATITIGVPGNQITCIIRTSPALLESFDLKYDSFNMLMGDSLLLNAHNFQPSNASLGPRVWTSSDPKVATVSYVGKVDPVSPGTAVISCTVAGVTETCTVTVSDRGKTYGEEILRRVNESRVANGLSPVVAYEPLLEGANIRALELVQLFSLDRPNGQGWETAVNYNFSTHSSSQRIAKCPKYCDQDYVDMFSTPCAITLFPSVKRMAIGYYLEGEYSYWVQVFTD